MRDNSQMNERARRREEARRRQAEHRQKRLARQRRKWEKRAVTEHAAVDRDDPGNVLPKIATVDGGRHFLWRYRYQLLPFYGALATATAGVLCYPPMVGPVEPPRWIVAIGAGIAVLTIKGWDWKVNGKAAKQRFRVAILTAWGWISLTAMTHGVHGWSLDILALLAGVLGVAHWRAGWWRTRVKEGRTRERLERFRKTWPVQVSGTHAAGTELQSVTMTDRGWEATGITRRPLHMVRSAIADLEARWNMPHGVLSIIGGDRAGQFTLRAITAGVRDEVVTDLDDLKLPSSTTANDPLYPGRYHDGNPIEMYLHELHYLIFGTTGGGKSNLYNVLLRDLFGRDDVLVMAADFKEGTTMIPWEECLDWLAVRQREFDYMLDALMAIAKDRARRRAGKASKVKATHEQPRIVVFLEDMGEILRDSYFRKRILRLLEVTRSECMNIFISVQSPVGIPELLPLCGGRIAMKVEAWEHIQEVFPEDWRSLPNLSQALALPGNILVRTGKVQEGLKIKPMAGRVIHFDDVEDVSAEASALARRRGRVIRLEQSAQDAAGPRYLTRIGRRHGSNPEKTPKTYDAGGAADTSGLTGDAAAWALLLKGPQLLSDLMSAAEWSKTTRYRRRDDWMAAGWIEGDIGTGLFTVTEEGAKQAIAEIEKTSGKTLEKA
jgi:hypothetical protein